MPNDAKQRLLEIRKPPSLQNETDLKRLGTSVHTTINTFRHLYAFRKHSLQTLTRYGGCDDYLHATVHQKQLLIWVAAIHSTVFNGAEDSYKQVASLYTWKGLSGLTPVSRTGIESFGSRTSWSPAEMTMRGGLVPVEGWLLCAPRPSHCSSFEQSLCQPKTWPWPALLLKAPNTLLSLAQKGFLLVFNGWSRADHILNTHPRTWGFHVLRHLLLFCPLKTSVNISEGLPGLILLLVKGTNFKLSF